jgi:hypothetical protein
MAARACCALLLGILSWAAPRAASAQSCHTPSLRQGSEQVLRLGVSTSFASYHNPSFTGEYQGLRVSSAFSYARFYAQASLPMYRLVRNGLAQRGLGDLGGDLRAAAFRSQDGTWSAGPELAATFPTGNAMDDLGMGHVMWMPGVWLRLELPKLALWTQLAYGRAQGSTNMGAHHHHGGAGPIVNPMNASEVEHALAAAYAMAPAFHLTARLYGAVPVAVKQGLAREIVALGMQALFGPLDVTLEVELPVVGTPFDARTLLAAGAQW